MQDTGVKVKVDSTGRPYVWVTKQVHGKDVKVKVYADQTKRPKQYVK